MKLCFSIYQPNIYCGAKLIRANQNIFLSELSLQCNVARKLVMSLHLYLYITLSRSDVKYLYWDCDLWYLRRRIIMWMPSKYEIFCNVLIWSGMNVVSGLRWSIERREIGVIVLWYTITYQSLHLQTTNTHYSSDNWINKTNSAAAAQSCYQQLIAIINSTTANINSYTCKQTTGKFNGKIWMISEIIVMRLTGDCK